MDLEIFGQHYPMAYTVAAQSKIAERFGGIEKIETAFSDEGAAKIMENVAFIAAALVQGAADRECVRCKVMGQPIPTMPTLSFEEICAALDFEDMKKVSKAVMDTMREGSKVTVEVEPKRGKNAVATL